MSLSALLAADFKTLPWRHQLQEFERHADDEARAWLWQMRSGKSKMTIDNACHLFKQGKIDCVVIVAPNGVHENWVLTECPKHMWDSVSWVPIVWQTSVVSEKVRDVTSRTKWLQEFKEALADKDRLMVVSFNSESVTRDDVRSMLARLVKHRKVMCVWDEASDFRSPGSKRTLMMRAYARRCPYRRILDGTLSHNSPLHVFSPYELLEKGALGFSRFSDFEAHHAIYEDQRGPGGKVYPKLVGYKNESDLKARMAPLTSVVLRADCDDMPPLVPSRLEFEMTDEQRTRYQQVLEKMLMEDVDIGEAPNRIIKLQQVSAGYLLDKNGRAYSITPFNPRLDALLTEVRRSSGKVIIWCAFHEDMDRVIAGTRELDIGDVLEYSGRVSSEAKLHARTRFQENDRAVKALVGHPAAGGRGIELSAASTIFWYSHTFNLIHRAQADERATKMGGGNISVVDVVGSPVDEYILNAQARKQEVAEDIAGRGLQAIIEELSL